jgi:hypothetical protein
MYTISMEGFSLKMGTPLLASCTHNEKSGRSRI